MEKEITAIVSHIMKSQRQLAKILEAERHIAERAANIVHDIPNRHPSFQTQTAVIKNATEVTKTITSYLISLAFLEEAIADNLTILMKELQINDEGE